MDDDNNNSRYRSYLWIIILIILAFIVCFLTQSPAKSSGEPTYEYVKNAQIVSNSPTSLSDRQQKLETKFDNTNYRSFYDKLNSDTCIAIKQLQRKAKEAKRIIPYFPDFPDIWLLPPKNKGSFASIPERYCIEFMHLLFPGYTFTKGKQSWIRNPKTNYPLELDGFCPELMIALEYNGIQHYVWPNFFHSTTKDFFDQRYRDQIKEEICIQKHICLIRIPYTIPLKRIPLAIYSKLLEAVPSLEL